MNAIAKKNLTNIGITVICFFVWIFVIKNIPDNTGLVRLLGLLLGYVGLLYFLVKFIVKIFQKPPPRYLPNNDHGAAFWSTLEQFAIANSPQGGGSGLVLGTHGLLRNKQGHLITVAGTGEGKGACLIIPTLLTQPTASFVVTDPKGENACITARSQSEYGQQVYILDPWNEQKRIGAIHGIPPSGFNPFDFIKMDMEEFRDSCDQIASFLVPDKPDSKEPYWNDRARTLIKTILMHIITDLPPEDHNFWTLYKMLRYSGDQWLLLLVQMKTNPHADGLISIAAEEFIGLEEAGETMAGIRSNAQNATVIFESPQLRKSLETSDFNPYDLTNGNCTVYIVIPERFLDTHSTWLRLVIGLCLKACNSRPNKRVNFVLDEFAVMGKMKDVQKAFAFGRGQNIVVWFFAQNLSQIKEIYGEDGLNTFIGNAAILQCFGGMKDPYTKEYFSKALGKFTAAKRVTTHGTNIGKDSSSTSTSSSIQTYEKDLMSADEIQTFTGIVYLGEGMKVSSSKVPYFKNQYQGVDFNAPWVSKEQSKLIKAGKIPFDEWHEHYLRQADPRPADYR